MKKCIVLLLLIGLSSISVAAMVTDGLIIHLDAGTLQLNDGDSVTSWADLAASDLVDGTVSTVSGITTPVFKTDIINGLPVVRFSGADILSTGTFNLASNGTTIFAVFTGGATGLKTERLAQIGEQNGVGGQVIGLEASSDKIDTDGGSGFRFNNGRALVQADNPLTTGFHTGVWQIGQGAQHQTAVYYVDGVLQTLVYNQPTRTDALPAAGNIFSVGNGRLSSNWIAGDYYTGDVAELLIYNALLSETEIAATSQYLMEKYFVPEPATLLLLGLGTIGTVAMRRRP